MESRGVEVGDIETLKNCFTYTGYDIDTGKTVQFVFHESRDDSKEFFAHFDSVKYFIGYNCESFDYPVIHKLLLNREKSVEELIQISYDKAQRIIEDQENPFVHAVPPWERKFKVCDLFKIWHFDNKAKRTSLKWIQYAIDFENIEEMPIHHSSIIEDKDIPFILSYNLNDVMSTYEFWKITIGDTDHPLYKGVDKIQLRKDIREEFGIDCINFNDVKIGDELNKQGYLKRTGLTKWELKARKAEADERYAREFFTYGECIPDYVSFKSEQLKEFLKLVGSTTVSRGDQEFKLDFRGTVYTIAKGGIHSNDTPRIFRPHKDQILRDADIGSQYPNAFRKRKLFPRHLGEEWLEQYVDTIRRRLDAKSMYKKTKEGRYQAMQEAYKLALNGGGFGKTGEASSWQYDPFVSCCVTIGNQFEILMLIEMLEIQGIHVISANTDGILCLFEKHQEGTYNHTCKAWEKAVGNEDLGQLEYTDYNLFVQTSVNDYLAIPTEGKVKKKGDFVTDFEIHKNKSARIVPMTLEKYYREGIDYKEFIKNYPDILEFCHGVKSIGENRLFSMNLSDGSTTELQKVNRYYISKSKNRLIKKMPAKKQGSGQIDLFSLEVDDGTRRSEVHSGFNFTPYNTHVPQTIDSYDIDYSYYIDRVAKIIEKIHE